MFFPRKNPATPDPRRFSTLRVSLNAPVVATDALPSAPARAAIVMWWEPDQRCALEVRVRATKTGRTVVYGFDGPLEDAEEVDRTLDAALNFAESMGFLFDEDVLSGEDTVGREKLVQVWTEFESGAAPGGGTRAGGGPEEAARVLDREVPAVAQEDAEAEPLELTELAPDESLSGDARLAVELASGWTPQSDPEAGSDAEVEPPSEPDPEPEPSAGTNPAAEVITLTKFRGPAPESPAEEAPAGSGAAEPEKAAEGSKKARKVGEKKQAAVGRVPILRRKGGAGRQERPGLLQRILGAF
jgi:hypothetical protein